MNCTKIIGQWSDNPISSAINLCKAKSISHSGLPYFLIYSAHRIEAAIETKRQAGIRF